MQYRGVPSLYTGAFDPIGCQGGNGASFPPRSCVQQVLLHPPVLTTRKSVRARRSVPSRSTRRRPCCHQCDSRRLH